MARPSARQPSGARTESQQQEELIQKLFKKPKRDNKELERLRETIERDQRELKDLLQEKLRQTKERDERRKEELEALITQSWRPAPLEDDSADGDYATYPATRIALNKADKAAVGVFKHIKSLIRDFRSMEDVIDGGRKEQQEKAVAQKWTQESEETERLLGLGRNKALRDARRLLGLDEKGESDGGETGDKMEGIVGGNHGDRDMEIQKALRYAARGVKRMVKCIPPEEVESST